jgi:non-heme chloroperoxidase
MAFTDSEGTRIYYDDRGKSEPVLLCLTGWCVHHTIFLALAERLSAQHRVLAMDWRGHGKIPSIRPGLWLMPTCSRMSFP